MDANRFDNLARNVGEQTNRRNMIKAARSGTRGRPPLGLGGSGGSSGATMAHNSSLTRGLLMLKVYHAVSRF